MKSRGCYETPGGTIIMAAHRELEALTLDRATMHYKQKIALDYADLIYNGQWFTALREALDGFIDKTQEPVTGEVKLRLYKGHVDALSRISPNSLYSLNIASFTMGAEYDQKDAAGFINLVGLPIKVRAALAAKKKSGKKAAAAPKAALHQRGCQGPWSKEMKLWGGRFEKGPAELFEHFSGSLDFDRRLLEADIIGSKAFASALERVGILTADERGSIHAAFDRMIADSADPSFLAGADDEDIHTFVIRKLKETAGAVADKIHTGRSRNEQVATDFRLWVRKEIRANQNRLVALMQALVDFAVREPTAILPGYTHLRRAQPVLWSHYLLAYFEMFSRDWERLDQAYQRTDVLPLGSGALAGSGLPFDREAIAKDLGFARISANSLDVVSDRDFALDFLYAASVTMLHLSRLSEDWILYSSDEFGFLDLGDEVTSGSSLMPQKKNPDAFELVRGKTGRICGHLQALMMTIKGLPLAYNRDLQEDKEPVFDASDHLAGSIDITRLCVETAKIHADRMEAAAEESWTCATELAEALSRKGVPFHRAHQIVGSLVLQSVRGGKRPREWTVADLRAVAPEFDEESAQMLAVRRAVENHTPPGGTAPATVGRALEQARQRLAQMKRQ